ncbi:acyltransferase family protein [Ureibacillus chungkukjangi]|uniref:Membrane-bound acyltransferase YfiQ involved in biofilm formation n=1 Tax=Ureibacillus chungkukjangi TaxID=1202712 RepID=A0A318TT87_9BACL|nr:acyltransferase family protein [Ureibacillus chungkukjangi]PYF07573.1 membrane-bound acyltransferase YfiQ involved in biofilm formation [Ureibacillus chungkukjangi]
MRIKEWDLLRVIACLSILLLHTTTFNNLVRGSAENSDFVHFVRILLCFATPTFILLSIIILAARYKEGIPAKFWSSRLQFLVIPYLVWAIADAVVIEVKYQNGVLYDSIINNIFYGGFVGWFVVVILQLYLLFWCMVKFKWPQIIVLPFAILIYFFHLQLFSLPYTFYQENNIYQKLYGSSWLIYFVIAYLIGVNYEKLRPALKKYRIVTLIFTILAGIYIWINFGQGQTDIHSRRVDIVFFVVGMTSMILAYGQSLPHFKITQLISKYAFMIYLIHWNVLNLTATYFVELIPISAIRIIAMFGFTLVITILIAKIISYFPFGKWIVGKIR